MNSLQVAIAYSKDAEKTLSLLENRMKRWGDRNIMQIAFLSPGYHLQAFIASKYDLFTGLDKRLVPRLRDLAPVARGSEEAGFTQPMDHLIATLCTLLYVFVMLSNTKSHVRC